MVVVYSSLPASTVDVTALSGSRFLVQRARQLPFRDTAGRINVALLEASVKAIDAGAPCDPEMVDKARAWLRHARKESADEDLTLDELYQAALRKRRAPEPSTEVRPTRRASRLKRLRRGSELPNGNSGGDGGGEVQLLDSDADSSSEQEVGLLDTDAESGGEEVQAILAEGPKGLLIRWAGFDASHDSWEPEANVSARLVAAFRAERDERRANARRDYGGRAGRRPTQLWCAQCRTHAHADNFSAMQRRADPERRSCLKHSAAGRLGLKLF